MPKIPTNTITQSPTSQPDQVLVDADSFTSSGKQLEMIGKTVGNIGDAFGKMQDMRDKLDANTSFRNAAGDIRVRMEQDPNAWDNQQKYLDELNAAKTDALGKTKNTIARLSVEDDLNAPYNSALIDMRSHARKNLNTNMVAKLQDNVTTLSSTFVQSTNPLEIHDAANSIKSNIEDSIKNGYIDAEKGQEYLKKTMEALPGKRVEHAIDQNPDEALRALKAGEYSGLQEGEQNKYEGTAMEAIKRNKKIADLQLQNIQTKNSIDVVGGYLNGSLDKDALGQLVVAGQVSPKLAQSVNDAMNGAASVRPSTRPDVYVDLMKKAYVSGQSEKDVVEAAMQAHSKGQLSNDDLTQFLMASKNMFEASNKTGPEKDSQTELNQNTKNALSVVDDWVKNYKDGDPQAHMDIVKDYQKQTQGGADSSAALQTAIKNQIFKDYPETVAFGDVPHVVVGKNSKSKYIFMGQSNVAAHRIYQPDKKAQ